MLTMAHAAACVAVFEFVQPWHFVLVHFSGIMCLCGDRISPVQITLPDSPIGNPDRRAGSAIELEATVPCVVV